MTSFETAFVIYFVYGLTFFSMGLVILLEFWRLEPSMPQKKLLLPLAIFGLMHGVHEWFEIFMLLSLTSGANLPKHLIGVRLGLLGGSFIALGFYSIRAYRFARGYTTVLTMIGAVTLPLFAFLSLVDVVYAFSTHAIPVYRLLENLIRHLLGVPVAAVATVALRANALKARVDSRRPLDRYLTVAAIGFALYSLSQLVVPSMNTFLAQIFNAELFQSRTMIPIQMIRTAAAIVVTIALFNATRFMEIERQRLVAEAQRARLQALEQQEAMRRDLLRHIVLAQEEERARIARELHDEMAQILTAFSLDLATLQQSIGRQPKYGPLIARLQDLGKQMSQGMLRMVYDLRPSHLDDLGLASALKFLADYEGPRLRLDVDLSIEGSIRRLDPRAETAIYRVVQEALTNVARHAQTNAVRVCLQYGSAHVNLSIGDSGAGFDQGQPFVAPRGWGLAGMKERIESVGGSLQVDSKLGQGTQIEARIPLGVHPNGEEFDNGPLSK